MTSSKDGADSSRRGRRAGARSERAGLARPPLRQRMAYLVARPFFALALLLGKVLPRSWLRAMGRGASRAVWALFPGVRRNLLANASRLLGPSASEDERRSLGRRTLASFATFIVEWVAPRCVPRPSEVFEGIVGLEHFHAALARGRGLVLVSLHMGNYELPSRELAAMRQDVAVVNRRERIGFLERLRERSRRERKLDQILVDDSPFFAIEVRERLRKGGVVLLALDQIGAPDARRFPFFHGEAPFSIWPARLAASAGAPIVPAACFRTEHGFYRVELGAPIVAEDRSAEDTSAELVRALEAFLARAPDQWLMVHDFWATSDDPAG